MGVGELVYPLALESMVSPSGGCNSCGEFLRRVRSSFEVNE